MSDGITIEIDDHPYTIPDDLDLNDVVALEEEGYSLEQMNSIKAMRFVIWRLVLRHQPDVTLEEVGAKVPLTLFSDKAEEEGPHTIPLSQPEAPSGTSSAGGNGNGSTGTEAKVETHDLTGRR